jgi:dTDP-4-dehydrorhamnose 3,5-epimerase-like enzyme
MNYKLTKHKKWVDERGYLAEFLSRKELKNGSRFGHIYFATFSRAGIIRGNHYHTRKEEHFGLAMGKVEIVIEDIKTKKRKSFILDADDHQFIRLKIGPKIAHAMKSLSSKAILIDYFSSPYYANHPDSFKYILIEKK